MKKPKVKERDFWTKTPPTELLTRCDSNALPTGLPQIRKKTLREGLKTEAAYRRNALRRQERTVKFATNTEQSNLR